MKKISLSFLVLLMFFTSLSSFGNKVSAVTDSSPDTPSIVTYSKQGPPNTNAGGGGFPLIISSNSVLPYISALSKNSNKVNHILQPKHRWKEISSGEWSAVQKIMSATMRYGTESKYGKSGIAFKKVYTKYTRTVVVTYTRKNGQILVSDAWVVPK